MKNKNLEKDRLRHAKYLTYMNILGAIFVALLASSFIEPLQFEIPLPITNLNNILTAFLVGPIGFLYLRFQLEKIEDKFE